MKLKRIMALILAFCMVLSTMSFSVFAEGTYVAEVGEQKFTDIQEAVAAACAAEGEVMLTLLADVTENVTLAEKVGLNLTFDGAGKTMNGTITVKALSDTNDNRRITIKNVNFVDNNEAGVDFISSVDTNHYPRITVEGCSFTGSGNDGDVAIRLKSSHSVVITDCTGTALHSFLQNTAGWNLNIEDVTVTDSKGGLALGTVQGVTVKDCNITTDTYGIRIDADTYNNEAVIESNTVTAFIPVVVRKVNTDSNITFAGNNTMTASNTDGLWCAIGKTEYEENGTMPEAPVTGKVCITLEDGGLSTSGVYGSGEVVAPVAKIGDNEYATLQDALEAAAAGTGNVTVEILEDIDLTGVDWNPVTVSAPGYPVVTVNGNNKKITGLNDMLFAGTWAGHSGLIINDLTIADSTIVNDEGDTKGNVGVGAFIGFPQASATVTLNNCHLVDSSVEGGHWTGGLIGYAAGYAGEDGPVFMNLTINECSVTGSTIAGKGSAGGIIGHATGNAWTQVTITDTTVSGNTVASTGSSTNKAGAVIGTIGAAGQATTVNGVEKAGGVSVAATVSGNNVTSSSATITTIYGRQGTDTGMLYVTGGEYDNYPIENDVVYAVPADGYKIVQNSDGTFGVAEKTNAVAKIGDTEYSSLAEVMKAAKSGETVELISDVDLAGTEWEPVSFKGKFNGNGYTIKNLTINKPGVLNVGFITSLNSTFENVTFENPTVTGGENTAVLAGRAGGSASLAKDIKVTGTIKVETTHSGYARAGVIVGGWAYGNYENITVDGINKTQSYIKHTGGGDGRYVAGIVGHADDVNSYVNCTVKNFTISGGWLCGAIAGPGPSDGLATGCTVENVDINADYSGGMFGWYYGDGTIENSTIKNVAFTGGSTKNGAIGGYSDNESATVTNVTIENVKNADGKPLLSDVATVTSAEGDVVTYATLADAVANAESGAIITILKNGEYDLPHFTNKELTFRGESKDGIIINDAPDARDQGWSGSSIHFETLTAKGATGNYHGLANGVVTVTYKDCNVNNLRFLYATDTVSFDDCTFNSGAQEHSFWTYGAKDITVTNCTFNYADRAVNCYSENGAAHETDISFSGCTFNYTGSKDAPEGAVEINSGTVKSIDVDFTSCNAPAKGAMWFNSQWDTNGGVNTTVDVEGTQVWPMVEPEITRFYLQRYENGTAAIYVDLSNVDPSDGIKAEVYSDISKSDKFSEVEEYTDDFGITVNQLICTTEFNQEKRNDLKAGTLDTLSVYIPIGSTDLYWNTDWQDNGKYLTEAYMPTNVVVTIGDKQYTHDEFTVLDIPYYSEYGPVTHKHWDAVAGVEDVSLPTATVTQLENEDLTFALSFSADEASSDQLRKYWDWYADFELVVNDDVTFNANDDADGYLSGQYDAFGEGWLNVPFEDVKVTSDNPFRVMDYADGLFPNNGLKFRYFQIYGYVQTFNCGVFLEEDFKAANPDFKMELALKMYDNGDKDGDVEGYPVGPVHEFSVVNAVARIGEEYFETLDAALDAAQDGDVVIELLDDVTLDYNAREAYGTVGTTSLTINGNGHTMTLNQKDSDWSSVGLANADAKLVLNNMTIEKTGYGDTDGAWNTHAINFTCEVEMNDVTVNQSMSVEDGATLNNVTINEANGYYGLWIDSNGQTVNVTGGAINATNGGRGIKIADEYVDSVKQVILTVDGTKFNTAKKAAVLVSSTAGAKVTANNADITNVAQDKENLVWVDEDWAAYYHSVKTSGDATKSQENEEAFPIKVYKGSSEGTVRAYFKTLDELFAAKSTQIPLSDNYIELRGNVVAENQVNVGYDNNYYYNFGTSVEGGVTMEFKYADDWNKLPHFSVGENVTLNVPYLQVIGGNVEIAGTINTGYLYLYGTGEGVTITETGIVNANVSNDKTVQVKGGTVLTVDGTLNTGTLNVWTQDANNSELIVSGEKAEVNVGHLHAWNGKDGVSAQKVVIENGATLVAKNFEADRGSEVTVDAATLTANALTLGYGDNIGKLVVLNNGVITNGVVLNSTAATLVGPENMNVTTNLEGYTVVYENGVYKVAELVYVATVTNAQGVVTNYTTLAEAVSAANAGDTVTLLADVTVEANETITLNGINFISPEGVTLTNSGTIEIKGETTLNIDKLSGNSIDLLEGAIVKDSTVGGPAYVGGNVTFRGDNTFTMITDFGDFYSKETPSMWTIETGASVTLTSLDRYGLGYGDNVTVYGTLAEGAAKNIDRTTLTTDDASVNMYGGLVGMTNSAAPNAQNSFAAKNAYLRFGFEGDKSFGNKSGTKYYGNYTFTFENVVMDANGYKFYEDSGTSNVVFKDSNLLVGGVLMTNDASSTFTYENTTILSQATSNGTDDKNQNAGAMKLVNSDVTYSALVTNIGTIEMDADSTFTAPALNSTGTFTIDATDFSGEGETKLVNLSGTTSMEGIITVENVPSGYEVVYGDDGDVTLVNKKFDIGTNMTLGGELSVNFYVPVVNCTDGIYAKIVKSYADGRQDVTLEIPYEQWKLHNSSLKRFSFSGVAAKEMSDSFEITIYDAEGNAISNTLTTSIRDYAMDVLSRETTGMKSRILMVDMLNYGAAAQTKFGYGTSDLANAWLTDEQKELATDSVSYSDVNIEHQVPSSLLLEDKIALNLYFADVTDTMRAVVEFTDSYGNKKTVNIPSSEFGTNGSYKFVTVDELAVADYQSVITCTIYDGENVHAIGQQSIEQYLKLAQSSDPLYNNIMKFATSAYAFMHQ